MLKLKQLLVFILAENVIGSQQTACGDGWVQFEEEKCFYLLESVLTWDQAKVDCQQLGSDSTLASISSQTEQDFIEDYLYSQSHVIDNVWIGGKRDNAIEFRYVNNTFSTVFFGFIYILINLQLLKFY